MKNKLFKELEESFSSVVSFLKELEESTKNWSVIGLSVIESQKKREDELKKHFPNINDDTLKNMTIRCLYGFSTFSDLEKYYKKWKKHQIPKK